MELLKDGSSATEAAVAAMKVLEDSSLTNAGSFIVQSFGICDCNKRAPRAVVLNLFHTIPPFINVDY